jgi:hypothetical protein
VRPTTNILERRRRNLIQARAAAPGGMSVFMFDSFGVQDPGKFFAISFLLLQSGEPSRSLNAPFGQQIEQVWNQGHVLPIANLLTCVTVLEFVTKPPDGQRAGAFGGRLEQGGFKRQDSLTIGTCAFRE